MVSFACVTRRLASYVKSIVRPLGEVMRVRFPALSRVSVSRLPNRSRHSVSAAACGRVVLAPRASATLA